MASSGGCKGAQPVRWRSPRRLTTVRRHRAPDGRDPPAAGNGGSYS